ncbi:MAG: sugar-phosphatase [Acidobacteriota bacterium]|nr:MAG: sugar-phosphatase [Acidobacteriota bacterium]
MSRSFNFVAVDLDGTLLSSSREIPEENRQALAACIDAGVAVAIVTGRRFPSARPYVDKLPIDPYVVANSGAIIKNGAGQLVKVCLLERGVAEAVIDIATDVGIEPVVHDGPNGEGRLMLREHARALPHVGRYLNHAIPPPIWVPSLVLERDPVQIGFAGGPTEIRKLAELLTRKLSVTSVSIVRTEYPREDLALLDVLAPAANKSSALKFLSTLIGIPMSETLAIGDNWNDLDMLEAAGKGVIMANAVEELKNKGLAETGSNDNAGVAEAIHNYVLRD